MEEYVLHVSPFGDCFVQRSNDPTNQFYAPPDSRRFPNYCERVRELRAKLERDIARLEVRYERVERFLPQGRLRRWVQAFTGIDERVLQALRRIDGKISSKEDIIKRLLEEERACS